MFSSRAIFSFVQLFLYRSSKICSSFLSSVAIISEYCTSAQSPKWQLYAKYSGSQLSILWVLMLRRVCRLSRAYNIFVAYASRFATSVSRCRLFHICSITSCTASSTSSISHDKFIPLPISRGINSQYGFLYLFVESLHYMFFCPTIYYISICSLKRYFVYILYCSE